jgi:hypothetical protein
MGSAPFIAVLALAFSALLGVRIAILLILRRGESGRAAPTARNWPDATVIPDRPDHTEPSHRHDPQ